MNFWETYEKLCLNAHKKPTQVGRELSISSSTITQWKNGSIPGGEKLMQIADYFGVSIDYLVGRTEDSTVENENIFTVSSRPVQQAQKETKEEPKQDGVTNEFFKVFEALDWSDKLDTMQFARDRMRKESV